MRLVLFTIKALLLTLYMSLASGITLAASAGEPGVAQFIALKDSADLYADIPDKGFPIPMLDGAPIPYEYVSLPEEGWEVTSYVYSISESGFMESYKEQLREAGFIDQGSVEHIESLWRYDRSSDGASLIVEMFHEESNFSISMYVNYL